MSLTDQDETSLWAVTIYPMERLRSLAFPSVMQTLTSLSFSGESLSNMYTFWCSYLFPKQQSTALCYS